MNLTLQTRYFLISILMIMAVYLPALYTGVWGMDDLEVLNRIAKTYHNPNYLGMFVRNHPTVYYRPFLTIFTLVDYSIWGDALRGFHFTNYLFHIFNAVLLYNVSFNIFKKHPKPYFIASISTLIFALNPLTCESVAWISGRSDIFGTFFSLLAVNSYFLKNKSRFVLTPFFALCGFFSKENAFAVVPIIILLDIILNYYAFNDSSSQKSIDKKQISDITKSVILWSFILLIPLTIYILLRTAGGGGFENDTERIAAAASANTNNFNISGYFKIFPAIAFYLKKLIIPFPLNFSISTINYPLYSLLFVIFGIANLYWIIKKQFNFIIIGLLLVFSFIPALPIAIGGVSWVPFAERYLYLSLCVWGISVSYILNYLVSTGKINRNTHNYIIIIILSMSIVGTLKRESDWKTNEKLFADTVKKVEPNNYRAIFNYAISHGRKDRITYLRQAEVASKDSPDRSWRANLYRAIAFYYAIYNLPEGYLKIPDIEKKSIESNYIAPVLSEKEIVLEVFKNLDIGLEIRSNYKAYMESALIVLKLNPKNNELKSQVLARAKEYYSEAYKIKPTAFAMYRVGGLERELNNSKKATECFQKVISKFPDSEYAAYSKIRLKKFKEQGLIK